MSKFAFIGTPEFARVHLQALLDADFAPSLVISQPDRRTGRKKHPQPSPVKLLAIENGLRVETPERIRQKKIIDQYVSEGLDLAIVVAYGQILAPRFIEAPKFGTLNIHGSLLPRWRGPAPIQRALMAGDRSTGCSLQQMVPAVDAGPILAAFPIPILPKDTSEDLFTLLAGVGSRLIVELLPDALAGKLKGIPQNERLATYAAKLSKDEGVVCWDQPNFRIFDQVRGINPWPGAWTTFQHKDKQLRVKLAKIEISAEKGAGTPGRIIQISPQLIVEAGESSAIVIERIQPETKKEISAAEFVSGYAPRSGDFFV